ncbi:MAG: BREX system Lon protease-like protein BrxL, partial [Porphyromonadaceae bacterium]|nr:BREX system Lon protease-like protein BrxL [Porphyromonadaceae bacterium]
LKKESFSKGYGLITDYIAAVLHQLRNRDLTSMLKDYAKFDPSLSERDHLAIRKTFSGMVKLLYPDLRMTDEEAFELVDFATESRKRVKDQLYIIDETFRAEPAVFKYINVKTGAEVYVDTLEQISNGMVTRIANEETAVETKIDDSDAKPLEPTVVSTSAIGDGSEAERAKRPRIPVLREKSVSFRMGQTGVTYKDLFAAYLADAHEITVEDPYIRTTWQVKNFIEFVTMLVDTRPVDDLKLHLVTFEEDEKRPDLIDKLDDIKDELVGYGIEFDYTIKEFHDRCIRTDTGWNITMGRGLDIFEKFAPNSVAYYCQSKRKCKEFTITYFRAAL